MKNLKYLPYAAFLVLAAVSYSCSDDDGGGGNRGGGGNGGGGAATSGSGMPTTAELGVEWPMSRVVDYDTEYLRLDYDADGRLTGGYDGSFGGNFTIETSPLAIEYRDTDPSYDNRHSVTDIKVNEDGYIVSARVTEIWDEPSAPSENWSVDGIIFLYPNCDQYLEEFLPVASCPIAVFDSAITDPDLINICSDDQQGLYLATKYIINNGQQQELRAIKKEHPHQLQR